MPIALELLAPAGNAGIGAAAIEHGADAVYIGASRFSARAGAGNEIADIARLIDYAHPYFAKVYVALNTILTDRELPQAVSLIWDVYNAGADGLILQDPGLLEGGLPPIPLIASTQMHNNCLEKVQFLEAVGFKRVILARELSLEEITAIGQKTQVELEAFVHGALCVSYSGQCYMSQAVAGRSANRGVCAQPCRSRYSLTDGDGETVLGQKFLLSLKDLNRIEAISALVAAGVTSFKIEGRYKDIGYVKNVTAAYRQAIDQFLDKNPDYRRASSGASTYNFSPDLNRTFNRGYSPYFLYGRKDKVGSMDTQKSIGRYVGTIQSVDQHFFRMKTHDLQNGDGLCFFTKNRRLAGFRVNRVSGDNIYPNTLKDLAAGTALYRNHDHGFVRMLNKPSATRRISVEMDFVQDDTRISLSVKDQDGFVSHSDKEVLFQTARDAARASAQIQDRLGATGNTIYRVSRLTISPEPPGFIPVAALNAIRRNALEALTNIRLKALPRETGQIVPNDVPYPEKILDFHANVLNKNARRFYARHGATVVEPAFETLPDARGKTVMTSRYCLRHQLEACPRKGQSGSFLKEPLKIHDGCHTYRLEFDCEKCRMSVILEDRR